MTIAEKLLRAKTDFDEVYDAGYDEGVTSVKTEEAKSRDDLTISGPTVTVPAGYYAENAEKTVATVEQGTPFITVNGNTGLITATVSQYEGYVSEGTKSTSLNLSSGQDGDFQSWNIIEGVTLFGKTGTLVPRWKYDPLIVQGCIDAVEHQRYGMVYNLSDFDVASGKLFGYDVFSDNVEIESTSSSAKVTATVMNYTDFCCQVVYRIVSGNYVSIEEEVYTEPHSDVSKESQTGIPDLKDYHIEILYVRFYFE